MRFNCSNSSIISAMSYELLRVLHFAAIFTLAGALIIENIALKQVISAEDARNLAKVDRVYGISAFFVFSFGLILWLWVGKPSAFYSANLLFQLKLGLFILMAFASIYPAVFFLSHRRSTADSIIVPKAIIRLLRLELLLLLIIPVLARLMARGIGLDG